MSAEKIPSRNCFWIHDSPSRYPSCEGPHTTVPPSSSRWVVETGRKEPRKKLNSAGTVVLSVMTSGSPALRSGCSLISDMSDSNSARSEERRVGRDCSPYRPALNGTQQEVSRDDIMHMNKE